MSYGYYNYDQGMNMQQQYGRSPIQENPYSSSIQNQSIQNVPQQYGNPSQMFMQQGLQSQQQPFGAQQQRYQRVPQNVVVRAVTGYEEAVAAQIPLDGTVCVFTDFGHNKIYTKQLNFDNGSANFEIYERVKKPDESSKESVQSVQSVQTKEDKVFVERKEFDSFKNDMLEALSKISAEKQQEASESGSQVNKSSNRGGAK